MSIERYINFSLLAFVFSLPYEYWDPFGISSYFTVTKTFGLFFFLFSFFDKRQSFELRNINKPLLALFALWILLIVTSNINYSGRNSVTLFHFTFLQNIILFWLISNRVKINPKLIPKIFLSLILGVFTLGVLLNFGIGIETDVELGSTRLMFFGTNPNRVGDLSAIAIFIAFHMLTKRSIYFGKATWLILLTVPILVNILILSGSRGALLVTLVGTVTLFFFQKVSVKKKIILSIVGFLFLFILFHMIQDSEIMSRRLEKTFSEHYIDDRGLIWKHSFDIFLDNPFFGIGNTGYEKEISKKVGMYADTHNIFLFFMVSGGFFALMLYIIFLYFILKQAKKYYIDYNDILAFGILILYLFLASKSGGAINIKLHWTLIAIVYGLGSCHKSKQTRILTRKLNNVL